MKTFELSGVGRADLGKKAAKAIRHEDAIPCVLYGGDAVVHFTATQVAVRHLIYTPEIFLVEVTVEGKTYTSILKDLQFHPVSDRLLHIDFLQVFPDKDIVIEVPVTLEGLAEGVKQGGKLSLEIRKLRVKGLYKNVPEKLTVNVAALGLGKTIQVGELSFPNLELTNAKNAVVVAVKLTRAARGAKAATQGKK